jgi:hypothetical protein
MLRLKNKTWFLIPIHRCKKGKGEKERKDPGPWAS